MNQIEITSERVDELLAELGQRLEALGARYEIVIVGGAALLALGFVARTTQDVDVVGVDDGAGLAPADPLPGPLVRAKDLVARDLVIDSEWLNARASDIVRFGLPLGFFSRCETRGYGPALVVHFAGRVDLICFKLHALVDRGAGGKHDEDLSALVPTRDELLAAARWSTTHDPSPGYRQMLVRALEYLGVENVDLGS
ncbi:MAG: DUF6036 family nucleotidyltransferase [Gaiellales bacterium]